MKKTIIERIHARSEFDPTTGCRIWLGTVNKGGVGMIRIAGRLRSVTHVAVELATGEALVPHSWVRPTCGNHRCIEPAHLSVSAPHGQGGRRKRREPIDRFNEKVCRGAETDCHIWSGAVTTDGYGMFWLDEKNITAHRAAWTMHHGRPIPAGHVVRHTCDEPLCVNPNHLQLGTQDSNRQDRVARGRTSKLSSGPARQLDATGRAAMLAARDAGIRHKDIVEGWAMSPSGVSGALRQARSERAARLQDD